MTTFFTSDLHLGHARIIEFCNRPFNSVQHMNEEIVWRWNATVGPDDTVYILGDLAMGDIDNSLEVVARLSGNKILVPGNHDRVWSGFRKNGIVRLSDVEKYQAAGLTIAAEQVRYTDFRLNDYPASWTLCHFPDIGDSHEAVTRYAEHRPPKPAPHSLLIHGHVHTAWKFNGPRVNVGVDVWDFTPVAELTLYSHWVNGFADPKWFM